MEKAIYLTGWFLIGCIASSFVAWLGSIHPALFRVMWIIYGISGTILALMLVLDDAVKKFLRISETDYYALLIAIASAILIGGVMTWLIGG